MPTSSASTTDSAKSASGGVQSLERAFDLLERMADAGGEVGLSELSASSGLPLPTIHRLMRTLEVPVGAGHRSLSQAPQHSRPPSHTVVRPHIPVPPSATPGRRSGAGGRGSVNATRRRMRHCQDRNSALRNRASAWTSGMQDA
ncbi:hypothetical protein SALBM311S_06962 [Streptomyces alboniger]